MAIDTILSLIAAPFPYIAVFSTFVTVMLFKKFQVNTDRNLEESVYNRILDSNNFMDRITRYVATNITVVKEGQGYSIQPLRQVVIHLD